MLLMIPGPVEVSPDVIEAFSGSSPGHLSPPVIEAHGRAIELMRQVWCAGPDAQPFIIPGSGTLAMDVAVHNVVAEGDAVLVVNTGYFSERIAEMARRRGAVVHEVAAPVGSAPTPDEVRAAAESSRPRVIFATHVDTSTGVRVDPGPMCEVAAEFGALTVFDGVCATAAERFLMTEWGADVYLTASQKAIGLPPGLALMVASPAALARRNEMDTAVPMALDWLQWLPIMAAYEGRARAYFSTPATNHIMALATSLTDIAGHGMESVFARHEAVAGRMRQAWSELGLELLPQPLLAANALSAVRYPQGIGPELVAAIAQRGVAVAGGLYPGLKQTYFRVGHMGYSTTREDHIGETISAVQDALAALRT
jgi:alanine-glyoxylate transaminase/serine-glyoxylate transaminase/serine-pyruvate transaminase